MNLIYGHHTLDYMLDSFERLGIKMFELYAPTIHFDPEMPSFGSASSLKSKLVSRGFSLSCVTPDQCAYPHNIAEKNEDVRSYAVDYFKRFAEITCELGSKLMLLGPGWGNVDEDVAEAEKRSIDSLRQIVEHAEKLGLTLAFEVLNRYESNVVYSLEGMARTAKAIPSENLKFCVDTVPVELEGKTLDDYFDVLGNRIAHIHMTDGDPLGHVPPGLGKYDMAGYFRTLSKYNYPGNITIEICDTLWSNDPEKATKIGYDTLCAALAESKRK